MKRRSRQTPSEQNAAASLSHVFEAGDVPFYTLCRVSVALGCVCVHVWETERVIYRQAAGRSCCVLRFAAATAALAASGTPTYVTPSENFRLKARKGRPSSVPAESLDNRFQARMVRLLPAVCCCRRENNRLTVWLLSAAHLSGQKRRTASDSAAFVSAFISLVLGLPLRILLPSVV